MTAVEIVEWGALNTTQKRIEHRARAAGGRYAPITSGSMKRASILPGTLPACDARSNAEEAVSHGERTSQRIRHATQTTSRHTKLLVVVQKFVRTIRAKIRLLAVLKRPDLTEHLDMLTTEQHAISIHKLGLYPLNWLWRPPQAAE